MLCLTLDLKTNFITSESTFKRNLSRMVVYKVLQSKTEISFCLTLTEKNFAQRISYSLNRTCLITPSQYTPESFPLEMRPTKSVPCEKDLVFLPLRCVLVIWVTSREILKCLCSPMNFWNFDISPVMLLLRQSLLSVKQRQFEYLALQWKDSCELF